MKPAADSLSPDPTAGVDVDHLKTWIGRSEEAAGLLTPALAAAFLATLDQEPRDTAPGSPAPPAIHWCLAAGAAPMSALGPDGHPERGGFLPPVPLPRRMWAAGASPSRIGCGSATRSRGALASARST